MEPAHSEAHDVHSPDLLRGPEGAAWVNPQLGSAAILDWASMGQTALAALLPALP
jgi:hypothetical protein